VSHCRAFLLRLRSIPTALVIAAAPVACRGSAADAGAGVGAGVVPAGSSAAAESIDGFVHRVVARLGDVPGLAVAVVRDTGAVYVGAAGYRDLEARLPATAATPYYVASSTKSFTAMAAALLAARGRLDLDAPLARYLPDLRLPPARPADSVTIRQLLTHTMGFANDAVVIRTAFTGEWTPRELIALLAKSRVTERSFEYDNLGYVVAGLVIDRVAGTSWKDVLARSLFAPLGMTRTTAYMSRADGWGVAVPYWAGADSAPRRLRPSKRDETMHAAGGVVSTAHDLARWLEANLAEGRPDGVQLLPAHAVEEAHRLQVRLPREQRFGPFRRYGYALGWYWADYGGDTVLQQFGSFAGARAHVSFMPGRRIGVAVLLNVSGPAADVADLVAAYAYDVMLGKPGVRARYDSLLDSAAAALHDAKAQLAAERVRLAERPSTLSLPAASYAGVYTGADLGTMCVGLRPGSRKDGLEIRLGPLVAEASPYTRPDAVRVEFEPGHGEVVRFFVSGRGVDSLEYAGYALRRTSTTSGSVGADCK
jgi:CubicO group peptidase (beta-lactamase class C family)